MVVSVIIKYENNKSNSFILAYTLFFIKSVVKLYTGCNSIFLFLKQWKKHAWITRDTREACYKCCEHSREITAVT